MQNVYLLILIMKMNVKFLLFCFICLLTNCSLSKKGKIFIDKNVCKVNLIDLNFKEIQAENDILINIQTLREHNIFLKKEVTRSQNCYESIINVINK